MYLTYSHQLCNKDFGRATCQALRQALREINEGKRQNNILLYLNLFQVWENFKKW